MGVLCRPKPNVICCGIATDLRRLNTLSTISRRAGKVVGGGQPVVRISPSRTSINNTHRSATNSVCWHQKNFVYGTAWVGLKRKKCGTGDVFGL